MEGKDLVRFDRTHFQGYGGFALTFEKDSLTVIQSSEVVIMPIDVLHQDWYT